MMRNHWRFLLLQSVHRSSFQNPTSTLQASKVLHRSFSYLSSFSAINNTGSALHSDLRIPSFRNVSSESAIQQHKEFEPTQVSTVLTEILSESSSNEEIIRGLASSNIQISGKVILNVLKNLEQNPEIAWKFFNFLLETANEGLNSQAYDLILPILCRKDYAEKFWYVTGMMKKKRFRVTKRTHDLVLSSFTKEGFSDIDKFKEIYGSNTQSSIEIMSSSVCKLIRKNEWEDNLPTKLSDLNCNWSNDLVAMIIKHLAVDPMKALMFFSWVGKNPSFKHDKLSYNAMIKVLAREDHVDKCPPIFEEMKEAGYQIDIEMCNLVVNQFYKRKMISHVVALYELMMNNDTKPSVEDFVLLLRKVVVSAELDMDLFARVVKMFTDCWGNLTQATFDSVFKALSCNGRLAESGKILNAMENGGLVPTKEVYDKIIYWLSSVGKSDEAFQIMDKMEASGCIPEVYTWYSLIHGQCVALDVEKASSSFKSMVEKYGVTDASSAFQVLMRGFCQEEKAEDAYKFLSEMVDGKDLRPLAATYRMLIDKLFLGGSFNEALDLLRSMKRNGYPPYLKPFLSHISNSGSGTDAMRFLETVIDTTSPSNSIFISVFKAFFKAGRCSEAENLLSECPSYIRSDAEVLNLFRAQKPEDAVASAVAA